MFKIDVFMRFQNPNLTQTAAHVFLLQHVVKPIPKSMQTDCKIVLYGIADPLSCFELMMLPGFLDGIYVGAFLFCFLFSSLVFVALVGSCWLLLAFVGFCWLLLAFVGFCWLSDLVSLRFWLLVWFLCFGLSWLFYLPRLALRTLYALLLKLYILL